MPLPCNDKADTERETFTVMTMQQGRRIGRIFSLFALAASFASLGPLMPAAAQEQAGSTTPPPHALPLGQPLAASWPDAAPGVSYDQAIPTPQQVLGYAFGQEISRHADIRRYMEALAAAAPDRMRLFDYGRSWEGRRLYYAVIGSPAAIARLDAIKKNMQRLADPRTLSSSDADKIIKDQPAIVWLAHAVHGDEISPADAALALAYRLLAAKDDSRIKAALEQTVAIINPLQNPDGRERFISGTIAARGLETDPDPASAEHDQPWPGGRFNHYLFDLNRDWFIQTQPETRAHAAAIQQWRPTVMVDAHEMGRHQTFFFPPTAKPDNPLNAPHIGESRTVIGQTIARWFDKLGIHYFTRETFELFYPGYGDTWPGHQGTISMTYEQGSPRGLVIRRANGRALHYADAVESHAVAALSTLEAAAAHRVRFLRDFYDFRVKAIEAGRSDPGRTIIIPAQASQGDADRLAALLVQQDIEVMRPTAPFKGCAGQPLASGYVIDTAQPNRQLIEALMIPNHKMDKAFVAEQERRRARGLEPELGYDVTAWSLPHLFNVKIERCARASEGELPKASATPPPGRLAKPDAKLAFLVPWGDGAGASFLAAALREGLAVKAPDRPFTLDGRRFPAGTLIVSHKDNPADLSARVAAIAQRTGAQAIGTDSGWVTDGPNFGSDKVVDFKPPKVALLWDQPTAPTSAGGLRYVIERQIGYPVSVIRADALQETVLARFDVLILPHARGDYADRLDLSGEALRAWVKRGGVLIGAGNSLRYLARPKVGLLSAKREHLATALRPKDGDDQCPTCDHDDAKGEGKENGDKDEDKPSVVPGRLLSSSAALRAAIEPSKRPPDQAAGFMARLDVDQEHWLGAGLAPTLHALVGAADIYAPLSLDQGRNVVSYQGSETLLAAGNLWEENRKQLAYKPFAMVEQHGRGFVIGFVSDPALRGLQQGLNPLLASAIFRGAAYAAADNNDAH
jgi:Zinc carboxypeptidase